MKRALVMQPNDNVAVALEPAEAGEPVALAGAGEGASVVAAGAIAFGHKLALRPIRAGEAVRKYGEVIGHATADIESGGHVHVHNMMSARAGGQRQERRGT